jgi:hypothetical protein
MTLAPCGNDCSSCPRFTATASGDPARLAAVAALWHRLGWRELVVSNAEIACRGCPPGTGSDTFYKSPNGSRLDWKNSLVVNVAASHSSPAFSRR